MNRRDFLRHAVAGSALASGPLPAAVAADKPIPIIDTHQHLWDLERFRLPWTKNVPALARNFLMEDYRQATAGLNVVRSVYMEVDVEPTQQQAEADYVTAICKSGKTPMAAAVVSGRPASDGFRAYVTPFKDNPFIKGLRQVLHVPETPAGYCLAPPFVRGVRLLGELGLSFDLCMRPAELADAGRLVDACPDTRFVLDHCGNADVQARDRTPWRRDMELLAKKKNLVCKVSGFIATAKAGQWTADDLAPIVNHTLDVFGPERVLFGGDWPVCTLAATYRQWVEALQTIVRTRPVADQRKLFHDNAVRVYRLGETPAQPGG